MSMQLIKCQLLENSIDPDVRSLFKAKSEREEKLSRVWRGTQLNVTVNKEVDLQLRFPTQAGRQGLGAGNYNPNPSAQEKRKLSSTTARKLMEEKYIIHTHDLARQSVWMQWQAQTMPFDLTWQNLIYGPGPLVIKFVLNASTNWVKTPDLLRLWGYKSHSTCKLCKHKQCTLHHIISNCPTALQGKRYTWRHDSVLLHAKRVIQEHIVQVNSQSSSPPTLPTISQGFVRAGEKSPAPITKFERPHELTGANDWQLLVDFETDRIVFPPDIHATDERPDIIIWSVTKKHVILVELTCPAEEGILPAEIRKIGRYTPLAAAIKGWSVTLMTIEVGARGFVARSVPRCFKRLGLKPSSVSKLCKQLSTVSARCSYAIYLARENLEWNRTRTLLSLE